MSTTNNVQRTIHRCAAVAALLGGIGLTGLVAAQTAMTPTEALSAVTKAHRVESGQKFFGDAKYVGSDSCKSCHEKQYGDWKATWHARMERLPSPDIIVGDFADRTIQLKDIKLKTKSGNEESVSPSALAFRKGDKFFFTLIDADNPANNQTYEIGKVLGGKWDQGYEVKFGGNFIPAPLRWSVFQKDWLTGGFNPQDWFAADGTPDGRPLKPEELPMNRVAEAKCNGCHTTGFAFAKDKETGIWKAHGKGELGVACESCHGPGSRHADEADTAKAAGKKLALGTSTIVNPLKDLNPEQATQICAQCHGRGTNKSQTDLTFPTGFLPGDMDIASRYRFWNFSSTSAKNESDNFWSNDWAARNRQQWQDFTKSAHYTKANMSCTTCHAFHGKAEDAQLRKKPAELCADCHTATGNAKMPNVEMFEGSVMQESGVTCIDCHMPRIGSRSRKTAKYGHQWDTSAHSMFVASPLLEKTRGVRSSCTECHGGKPNVRGKLMPSGEQTKTYTLDDMTDRAIQRAAYIRTSIGEAQQLLGSVKSKRPEVAALVDKANSKINFVLLDNSKGAHNYLRAKKLVEEANKLAAEAAGMK